MQTITIFLLSYFLGSIPFAYIFGKILRGIDIRRYGSGNVGATNAFRVLGKPIGLLVLFLDVTKGLFTIILANKFYRTGFLPWETVLVISGILCVIGHSLTIFLRFKGGKGIATSIGVLWGLSLYLPHLGMILIILILIWILIFTLTRIVSVASIISALFLPLLCVIYKQPTFVIFTCLFLSTFVLYRHKSNLKRILKGEEKPLDFGKRKQL
ncbi:MAG: glycerol-3-phosphate 1-O-acyltransferase PlsY [Candidatus Omnitrophica bacterium]|nr:glycerol-3-phosphate 1-O-acyltransferase PlsY [Candidatus Omnitrophota bacterium]